MISKQFQNKGYALIKNAISEEFLVFLTQYFLFREGQDFKGVGDNQSPGQFASYADPAVETLLLMLKNDMEERTGLTLLPTYSYFRVYRNNSKLDNHLDRPACEISATLCINYDYGGNDFKWPIFMNEKEIIMEPGDLVIYKGCEIPHYRPPLINNLPSWHIQTFLHYVDANGPNAEHAYDKRGGLGIKKGSKVNKPYIIEY